MGLFTYIIFGTCKDVVLGPTAVQSLLTLQSTHGSWQKAALLNLLVGFVQFLMGAFGLGFVVDFVSDPVSSGFTSAIALIVLTSQIKDFLGIKAAGHTFLDNWKSIVSNIQETSIGDTVLGAICLIAVLLMRVNKYNKYYLKTSFL